MEKSDENKEEQSKQDNSEEDKKPEDTEKAALLEKMASFEKKMEQVDKLEGKVDKILKVLSKQEEDEKKPEDEEKQEDDKKPDEEKKQDDDKKPDEEDKKKLDPVPDKEAEPGVGEGEVKLPKADAGETDEDAKPETDKVNVMEKAVGEVVEKKMKEVFKSMGFSKSTTPRPNTHEIAKSKEQGKDMGLDILKKAKTGKLDTATMNREIKKHVTKNREDKLKQFLEEVH